MCGPGEYMNATDAGVDNTCIACSASTYMDAAGHHMQQCKPHMVCGKGEQLLAATGTAPGVCVPCGPDVYQEKEAHSEGHCKERTRCGAGRVLAGASPSSSGTCKPCPTDTFLKTTNHTQASCLDQPFCQANEFYFLAADAAAAHATKAICMACSDGQVQIQARHRQASCMLPEGVRTRVIIVLPCVQTNQLSANDIKLVLVKHSNGTLSLDEIDDVFFTGGKKDETGDCLQPATATVTMVLDDSTAMVTRAVTNINTAISGGKVSIPVHIDGDKIMMSLEGAASMSHVAADSLPTANSTTPSSGATPRSSANAGSDDEFDPAPIVVVIVLLCLAVGIAAAVWRHKKYSENVDIGTVVAFANPAYSTDYTSTSVQDGDLYDDMGAQVDAGRTLKNATYEENATALPQNVSNTPFNLTQ